MKQKRLVAFLCLLSSFFALLGFILIKLSVWQPLPMNSLDAGWWHFSLLILSLIGWLFLCQHYHPENISYLEAMNKLHEGFNQTIYERFNLPAIMAKMDLASQSEDWRAYNEACYDYEQIEKKMLDKLFTIKLVDYHGFYFFVVLQVIILFFYCLAIF